MTLFRTRLVKLPDVGRDNLCRFVVIPILILT